MITGVNKNDSLEKFYAETSTHHVVMNKSFLILNILTIIISRLTKSNSNIFYYHDSNENKKNTMKNLLLCPFYDREPRSNSCVEYKKYVTLNHLQVLERQGYPLQKSQPR